MTDLDAACLLKELSGYNQAGEMKTPQMQEYDTIFQCAMEHAVHALEERSGMESVQYEQNRNRSFSVRDAAQSPRTLFSCTGSQDVGKERALMSDLKNAESIDQWLTDLQNNVTDYCPESVTIRWQYLYINLFRKDGRNTERNSIIIRLIRDIFQAPDRAVGAKNVSIAFDIDTNSVAIGMNGKRPLFAYDAAKII